jgi:hypothetical protein
MEYWNNGIMEDWHVGMIAQNRSEKIHDKEVFPVCHSGLDPESSVFLDSCWSSPRT